MKRLRLAAVLLALLMLQACSANFSTTESERRAFTDYHRTSAQRLQNTGQLHQALLHWRVLASLDPGNASINREIDRLIQLIDARTAPMVQQGRKELASGKLKPARKTLLSALAINPEHQEALVMLRKLSTLDRSHVQSTQMSTAPRQLTEGADKDNTSNVPISGHAAPEKQVSQPKKSKQEADFLAPFQRLHEKRQYQALIEAVERLPSDAVLLRELAAWLSDAYIALARSLRDQGQLKAALAHIDQALLYPDPDGQVKVLSRKVRNELARKLYATGRELLHSDIDQAIALWEEALTYDEGFAEAIHELEKAYRIRKNLGRIKESP